ncbi:MAG: hypothetical protein A3K83_00330 [Omnitrophica WOR_2 bacterium RBG_13_44_8b]|nr:MAG: hypothetical protein A3K83_00330 [Omnitrophica WOR_2 bacterium RBG_13_44_8b]
MDNSILLAKFIGPFIIIIGIGILFNTKIFLRIGEDFFKNSALVYISGIVTFLMGMAIVLFHNIWVADWRVIITLFGWSTLIKGAWLIILPGTLAKVSQIYLKNIKFLVVPWIIMIALGILLTVKGY